MAKDLSGVPVLPHSAFLQRIMMTLSEDTTVQDIVEQTLKQMNKSLEKMDRFVLHVVPKEYQQKKFIPDESTSTWCTKHRAHV